MRPLPRKTAVHETIVMQKNASVGVTQSDFQEGQRVMTVDGIAGKIVAVAYGPYPSTEDYEVVLDNGMGGGTYTSSQLRPLVQRESSKVEAAIPFEAITEHTADIDYPELGSILEDRLPNESLQVYAARNTDALGEAPDKSEDPAENADQDQLQDPDDVSNKAEDVPGEDPDPNELTEQEAPLPNVTPPSACSFCGHPEFEDPQMTGRGVRMRCAQCGGTMKSWGGQWEPEFPNSSQNHASEGWDYRSGGPGGVVQAPGVNYKSTSLQVHAGIINWIMDKIYDQMKKREEADVAEPWWNPKTPENTHGLEGPEQTHTLIAPHVVTHATLSDLNDDEWRFHFTASWMDVQAKARRIRSEGHVKILEANRSGVVGEVQGDTNVYETQLNYIPGSKRVAYWACGCKWASYSWGRSPAYKRYEGRLCSHALALQYEAGARGMFGKDVASDTSLPAWQMGHDPVVVQYDRNTDNNLTRRVTPSNNRPRRFSALTLDSDGIYEFPQEMDLAHAPIYASLTQMIAHNEDVEDVVEHVASFDMDREAARILLHEAYRDVVGDPYLVVPEGSENASAWQSEASKGRQTKHKVHHKHDAQDARKHAPVWGWGTGLYGPLMWCPQCNGSGCGHCAGQGQVPATNESVPTQSATAATPDETPDSGADISGMDPIGASLKTADRMCPCPGSSKIEPHSYDEHPQWAERMHAAGKTDAWGHPLMQPYDGHGAWSCNNYSCAEHPQEMYQHQVGHMPGWLQHDTDPHRELTHEINKSFYDSGTQEDGRYLLDQQHTGPSKFSIKHEADYSSADPLAGVENQYYYSPTPHSFSQNPASTGWATSQDPGDWGNSLISNDFGVTFDASLHEEPEPALPSTDGYVDDGGFALQPVSQDRDDTLSGNTSSGPFLPSSDVENEFHTTGAKETTDDIVAAFQMTAGGQALATDVQSMQHTAMKEFSYGEQQALINEGQGIRARNFDDLKIAGTHYELLPSEDLDENDLFI